MGEPKALLRLGHSSQTLPEIVTTRLQSVADESFLVGQADWDLPGSFAEVRRVHDAGQGATDGVIAALEGARFDLCIVAGCDMPFLDGMLLREIVSIAGSEEKGVTSDSPRSDRTASTAGSLPARRPCPDHIDGP